MEHLWIAISVFAALMQAVRTAAQKRLNRDLSNLATTYVRSVFGLPVLAGYLLAVTWLTGEGVPAFNAAFLITVSLGALAQVLATMLLIHLFTMRSFAVGTVLSKCDIVMTALLGALFFSERLTPVGVAALLVVTLGVVLLAVGRLDLGVGRSLASLAGERATHVALLCALLFTFAFLFLREATLAVGEGSFLWRGAWSVLVTVVLQVAFVGVWMARAEPQAFGRIAPHWRLSSFIGATSAAGSIGWFTAFALQNASYVRAVGQVEVVFTLLISWLYFKEQISKVELAGIAVTVLGVLMFRLV